MPLLGASSRCMKFNTINNHPTYNLQANGSVTLAKEKLPLTLSVKSYLFDKQEITASEPLAYKSFQSENAEEYPAYMTKYVSQQT